MDEKLESPLHNVKKSIFGSGHLLLFSVKKKSTQKMPLRHHTIIYTIVAQWLRCWIEHSFSQTEKDSQMPIVLMEQSLSQGRDVQPYREFSFLSW